MRGDGWVNPAHGGQCLTLFKQVSFPFDVRIDSIDRGMMLLAASERHRGRLPSGNKDLHVVGLGFAMGRP
jgi:hypothetical protein